MTSRIWKDYAWRPGLRRGDPAGGETSRLARGGTRATRGAWLRTPVGVRGKQSPRRGLHLVGGEHLRAASPAPAGPNFS